MSDLNLRDGNEIMAKMGLEERLSQLIRSVVAIADPHPDFDPVVPANGLSEHVLFDLDVDGDRYILIKTAPIERSVSSLSPREREIVRMVAQGHQNKVIAAVLNISSWTVCTHLRRIFAKLGVSSRAAMVAKMTDFGGVTELQPNVSSSTGRGGGNNSVLRRATDRQSGCRAANMNPPASRIDGKQAMRTR